MKKLTVILLVVTLLVQLPGYAQKKLKKSDRLIVSNISAHVTYLNGQALDGRKAGSNGEKLADEYIAKQFAKYGLKPAGDKEWFQEFKIYDGKNIKPSTMLKINDDVLVLNKDYFPFAFSASKSTEAAVAIALAENDVPWFKDIGELMGDDGKNADTIAVIRKRAKTAADKGASALIIYNKSGTFDLQYDRYDRSVPLDIPVVYISGSAYKRYASSESDIIDVKLNVELEEKNRTGTNVIGYSDNGADSTVVVAAHLEGENNVAALMEVARLIRSAKPKTKNYLFIVYCGENQGANGATYFKAHPLKQSRNISRELQLDSLSVNVEDPKGLNLVKRSVDILRTN